MKYVGAHVSVVKGISTIQAKMDEIGANTCGFFLKNPINPDFNPLDEKEIKEFLAAVKEPANLMPDSSYLTNLVNHKINKSMDYFLDDMERCYKLGIKRYNIHPGSDTKRYGIVKACAEVSKAINKGCDEFPNVIVNLEIMAGQGHEVGKTFEELKMIIDGVKDKSRVGVTLDTCQMFCAGYNITTKESFTKVMEEFDSVIGIKYLQGVHLDDSKKDFNSHKNRHESLGKGKIGLGAFKFIMNSKYFENIPMILETPNKDLHKDEIKLLRSFIKK